MMLTLAAVSLTLAAASLPIGQAPQSATCRQSLDSLDAKVRRNYAGFLLEVRGSRRQEYESMLARFTSLANREPLDRCYDVLAGYVAWFEDPHLFVFQSQVVDSAMATGRAASLDRVAVSEADVRENLAARRGGLDPIEGIWYDGHLRVAVIPDTGAGDGHYVGVVLAPDTAAWPVGAVRARFARRPDGSYATDLLTRGFAELRLTARIHKRVLMRLSPGIWGKEFPVAQADTGVLDPEDPRRPRVSIRRRSVVFSIPSHDPAYASVLDSLVRASLPAIAERALLIVDLRGNEGGGSFTTRALHPLITTAERRSTPFDSGPAVMLSSPDQMAYARRFTGNDTSAFVRSLIVRMEASPGELVLLQPDAPATDRPEPVTEGSWRVAVLVDGGTVSASEVTVLRALRSTRAVVVGEPTAGALDYQSVFIVGLGTGDRRWALGYPTITAHADLPRRGMRGRGIAPELPLRWAGVEEPLAEVERLLIRNDTRPGLSPPDSAAVIDTMLTMIRTRSVHRHGLDWPALDSAMRGRLGRRLTFAGQLEEFRYLFERVDDVHSGIIHGTRRIGYFRPVSPERADVLRPLMELAQRQTNRARVELLDGNIGYLLVPSVYTAGRAEADSMAQAIRDLMCGLVPRPVNWIIDLRLNMGGNNHPMFAALAPLFGEGDVGGFRDADGRSTSRWHVDDGVYLMNGERTAEVVRTCDLRPSGRVAVLIGPITMSSGEMVAIAFRGRPGTRLIGEPTPGGYTTVNNWHQLADGLVLNLAEAFVADRTGAVYRERVDPDTTITGGDAFEEPRRDAKVAAALRWLTGR